MDIVDILVSYQKADNSFFHALKDFSITRNDFSVRPYDLRAHFKGKVWRLFDTVELIKVINRPNLAIVLLSQNYLGDSWLMEELRALYTVEQHLKKPFILPVLVGDIQDSEIPVYFREPSRTIIDYRKGADGEYEQLVSLITGIAKPEKRIFIGHGRSLNWIVLKDFLQREHLEWEEFNSVPTAGEAVKERLEEVLHNAHFAFLIMTAEDEHSDGTRHARENVIHEVGLFQGRLGFRRAIVLLEEGCAEFSNKSGLVHISFPRGNIKACFQEIREVLQREGIIN